jgi:hypothetical protein
MHLSKYLRVGLAGLLLASATVRADFNDGVVAHLKGDYAQALQTMLPLAQTANHPLAQYYLGIMYFNGQGVEQDLQEAGKWFDTAARQGVSQAQYRLGEMYAAGKGVPQDFERAYAWLSVASHLGHTPAAAALKTYAEKLSTSELAQAQKLSDEYIQSYGKKPEAQDEDP